MRELDHAVLRRMKRIRAIAMDIDGVLTDGGMYYGEGGEVMKRFHVRDGMGIAMLKKAGFKMAWITGEETSIVMKRARKLRIDDVFMGANDKSSVLEQWITRIGMTLDEVIYIGDDLNDVSAMKLAGLSVAVADAAEEVKSVALLITDARGGQGAVRELADLILAHVRTPLQA